MLVHSKNICSFNGLLTHFKVFQQLKTEQFKLSSVTKKNLWLPHPK